MKHIKSQITVEMTQEEAKILQCIFVMLHEADPLGAVSNNLGIDIDEVVRVKREFEDILTRAI